MRKVFLGGVEEGGWGEEWCLQFDLFLLQFCSGPISCQESRTQVKSIAIYWCYFVNNNCSNWAVKNSFLCEFVLVCGYRP